MIPPDDRPREWERGPARSPASWVAGGPVRTIATQPSGSALEELPMLRSISKSVRVATLVLLGVLAGGPAVKADVFTVTYGSGPGVTINYTGVSGQGTMAIPFSVTDNTTGSSFTAYCVDLNHDQYSPATYTAPAYSVASSSALLPAVYPDTGYDTPAYSDLAYRMNYMGSVFNSLAGAGIAGDPEVGGAVQLALWTLIDRNFSYSTGDTKLIADTNALLGLLGSPGGNGTGGLITFQTSGGTSQVLLAGYSTTAAGHYASEGGILVVMHPTPGSPGVNQNLLTWGQPSINLQSVPEPSTFALAGLGVLAFAGYALRRRPRA
jgi:hypothetical protein